MNSATLRREILLEKARSDKEVVEIVNFMIANRKNIDTVLLSKYLATVLPSRCADLIAPRFKMGSLPSEEENQQFQETLKQFSKMEMRLLFEVVEKMIVLMSESNLSTPVEIQAMLKMFSIHQCSTCGENDIVCCIL
jgi:hypothetical protein